MSQLRDLREVPLLSIRADYGCEVAAIVRRMVDGASVPTKPSVAAFSSFI